MIITKAFLRAQGWRAVRRGLERYAPSSGYDVGMHARQKYAQLVVQKAGIFPGDWVLDVETGTGILGVNVARAFTRAKVVVTDAEGRNLLKAKENAAAEGPGCADRLRLVRCLPDALPFKDETFFFATVGLALARQEEPLDVLDEVHRATGFYGKVYAPALDLRKMRRKPLGWKDWVFTDEVVKEMREMGFGKVQTMRILILPDGAQLQLVTMKRFDPEGDEDDLDGDEEADEGAE
jgi:ubiquinone/menaquinone biosynthesis C-methylase UbiE